ncbi:hypothetical protein HR51_21750 [Burkholderia cepacia]|nr:hypothetical protein HR51_21750 [Burkholderia cepacia]
MRQRICGLLAGPIAESYFEQREFNVWDEEGWTDPSSDVEKAMGLAQLLPYRSEFEHACDVTSEALRRPEIWMRVIALADELERTGNLCSDAIDKFLPKPDLEWPPSAASRWRGHPTMELVQ